MNKDKYKFNYIDSTKSNSYIIRNDYCCINLNALVHKVDSYNKIAELVKKHKHIHNYNLCNLASLCGKLNIFYGSKQTLLMIKDIAIVIKSVDKKAKFVFNNVNSANEIDLQPFDTLISIDSYKKKVIMNLLYKKALNLIGFMDIQFDEILQYLKYPEEVLPKDIFYSLPIKTVDNLHNYLRIRKLLNDRRLRYF